MAATVIDALVVSLGLDIAQFERNSAKSIAITDRLKGSVESAERVEQRRAKNMAEGSERAAAAEEARARKVTDSYRKLGEEVAGLLAIFTAGKSITNFVDNVTASEAATGRLSKNIQVSVEDLSMWSLMVQQTGGTAEGLQSTMAGLSVEFEKLRMGQGTEMIPGLTALGLQMADLQNLPALLDKVHAAMQGMSPQRASLLGKNIGLDQGLINTLSLPDAAYQAAKDQARRSALSKDDTDQAQARTQALNRLENASARLGETILTQASPAIIKLLNALAALAEWAEQHPDLMTGIFVGLAAASGLKAIAAIRSILQIVSALKLLTTAATEARVALTAGEVLGGAGALGGTGLLGLLAAIAPAAAFLYELWPSTTNGGRDAGNPGQSNERRQLQERGLNRGGPSAGPRGTDITVTDLPPEARALLNAIAGGESDGSYRDQLSSVGARGAVSVYPGDLERYVASNRQV